MARRPGSVASPRAAAIGLLTRNVVFRYSPRSPFMYDVARKPYFSRGSTQRSGFGAVVDVGRADGTANIGDWFVRLGQVDRGPGDRLCARSAGDRARCDQLKVARAISTP